MKKAKVKVPDLALAFKNWREAENAYWERRIEARIKELVPKVYGKKRLRSSVGKIDG